MSGIGTRSTIGWPTRAAALPNCTATAKPTHRRTVPRRTRRSPASTARAPSPALVRSTIRSISGSKPPTVILPWSPPWAMSTRVPRRATPTGALDTNAAVLPRAYFPKTVSDLRGGEASRKALETLDPAPGSVVLEPHPPVRQDPAAVASITAYVGQSYRVRYRAASPSLLKLSESWFPGWRAFLGRDEIPVVRVDHALMGAVVPAGSAEIRFEFRSNYFRYGLAITVMALLILTGLAFRGDALQTLIRRHTGRGASVTGLPC